MDVMPTPRMTETRVGGLQNMAEFMGAIFLLVVSMLETSCRSAEMTTSVDIHGRTIEARSPQEPTYNLIHMSVATKSGHLCARIAMTNVDVRQVPLAAGKCAQSVANTDCLTI